MKPKFGRGELPKSTHDVGKLSDDAAKVWRYPIEHIPIQEWEIVSGRRLTAAVLCALKVGHAHWWVLWQLIQSPASVRELIKRPTPAKSRSDPAAEEPLDIIRTPRSLREAITDLIRMKVLVNIGEHDQQRILAIDPRVRWCPEDRLMKLKLIEGGRTQNKPELSAVEKLEQRAKSLPAVADKDLPDGCCSKAEQARRNARKKQLRKVNCGTPKVAIQDWMAARMKTNFPNFIASIEVDGQPAFTSYEHQLLVLIYAQEPGLENDVTVGHFDAEDILDAGFNSDYVLRTVRSMAVYGMLVDIGGGHTFIAINPNTEYWDIIGYVACRKRRNGRRSKPILV